MYKNISKLMPILVATILCYIQPCNAMEQTSEKKIEPESYYLRLSLLNQTYFIAYDKLDHINQRNLQGKLFTDQEYLEYCQASLAVTKACRKIDEFCAMTKKATPKILQKIDQLKKDEIGLLETIKEITDHMHNNNNK